MKKDADLNIGVCWYKEEQWERLKEIVADPESIEDTYQQWRKNAEKALSQLKAAATGVNVKKVSVDTEEMLLWANEHGRTIDGEARSEYALYLLQHREKRT